MYNLINFENAKKIIRQGILEKIKFTELRKRLPDLSKRQLQNLVFDIMEEQELVYYPFPDMFSRPRLSRKPINVSEDGNINISSLLKEKGFHGKRCQVYSHIGPKKITLTVKAEE